MELFRASRDCQLRWRTGRRRASGTSGCEAQNVFRSRGAGDAWRLLRFSNGAALHKRQLQLSPAALQAMTGIAGGHAKFPTAHPRRGEMREHRPGFAGAASRGREMPLRPGKRLIIAWLVIRTDCEGAVGAGLSRARTKFFARTGSREFLAKPYCVRRFAAGKGFARRENGADVKS